MRERIQLFKEVDLQTATIRCRQFAMKAGMEELLIQKLATATSELTRNVYKYADCKGWAEFTCAEDRNGRYVQVDVVDRGPGISDISQAMEDHFTTSGTLGLGLPGVRRLVDYFEIQSSAESGTHVCIRMLCTSQRRGLR